MRLDEGECRSQEDRAADDSEEKLSPQWFPLATTVTTSTAMAVVNDDEDVISPWPRHH